MPAADVLEFAEIAELISLSRSTTVQALAKRESPGLWSLHDGVHRVHTSEYPFEVLYLYAHAKKEDVEDANRKAFREGETHVVYAASLDQRHRRHRQLFEARAKGLWTTRDYLASFLRGELDTYIQELKALTPRFYIHPQFETPIGVTRKTPNPMLEFLRDDDIGLAPATSLVAVVLAEPGQGKTYQSQYLASTLASFSVVVPIYIDSKQWSTMSVEDLRSIYKTVAHSFRSFHSPISWLEGREEQFLRSTLKANLFKIVFDGFDEYILWNQGRVRATDALKALVDLASETQSRIVLTSRTSFWHGHIEVADESDSRQKCLIYRIKPFEQQQARGYFEKRFSKDRRADRAIQVYSELAKANDGFLGRGFVLSLVADLVEDEDVQLPPLTGRSGLNWILEALCEREARRQRLPLTGAQQMEAFRLFALDVAAGTEPSTLALQVALSSANGSLSESDLQSTIDKLANHPIIRPGDDDRWDWTERQIGLVLLADTLLKIATREDRVDSADLAWLQRFGRSGRPSNEELDSLAATAVDLARARLPEGQQDAILSSLVKRLIHSDGSPAAHGNPSMRLAFELVSRALERQEWRARTLEERREAFLSLLGDAVVHDWHFHGTVSRMDLRGAKFENCRFEQVYWSKVKFDSETEFRNCAFIGGGAVQCEGFGLTRIAGGTRDKEADVFIRREQVVAGKKNYSADDLKADMRSALMKFVFASATGFRTIKKSSIRSGTLAHSKYRDDIVKELERSILGDIHISGLSEGGYAVRAEAEDSLRFYVQNNVMTGPLKDAFERLRTSLKVPGV
jgi:hypothetical protein